MTPLTWKPYRKSLAGAVTRLWNRALGDSFPMSVRLLRQNIEDAPGFHADDSSIIKDGDEAVGFIATKRFRDADPLREQFAHTGWIEALAVDPARQGQGIGRDLLAWAMYKLRSEGADRIQAGGGFRHFLPGVPAESVRARDMLCGAGFQVKGTVYDMRGSLRGFVAPPAAHTALAAAGAAVRPGRGEDTPALMSFLLAEFPGRWRFDSKRFLDLGGDPADFVLLWRAQTVIGFARIHHAHSKFLAPPQYWRKLLAPASGGLGPIGVAAAERGKGLGLALLQLALEYDAGLGVQDAVIDWTSLVDFYARAGFSPWKSYLRMEA